MKYLSLTNLWEKVTLLKTLNGEIHHVHDWKLQSHADFPQTDI